MYKFGLKIDADLDFRIHSTVISRLKGSLQIVICREVDDIPVYPYPCQGSSTPAASRELTQEIPSLTTMDAP